MRGCISTAVSSWES